mmetsp:Transcript_6584/g.14682  ORF Transcript_6584/g.14682 Transcript_6584/m.14682 type:complete len:111 (+) Transcript_6584:2-334(+)
MLVGTARDCATVGEADEQQTALVQQVVQELQAAVEQTDPNVQFAPGTLERLRAYTTVVADFPCGVKEFEWRNQFFYQLQDDDSTGAELCPLHNRLLRECQAAGKLGFELE